LLAALQREARLLDLIQEPLQQYSDAQVGVAARVCLEKCRGALRRMFDLQPAIPFSEGSVTELPPTASPARYQWLGSPPESRQARVVHPGWEAKRCELPTWTGSADEQSIVAPAQIEAAQRS
jgi:hypothetical protein